VCSADAQKPLTLRRTGYAGRQQSGWLDLRAYSICFFAFDLFFAIFFAIPQLPTCAKHSLALTLTQFLVFYHVLFFYRAALLVNFMSQFIILTYKI
jgi:hypothetical protein